MTATLIQNSLWVALLGTGLAVSWGTLTALAALTLPAKTQRLLIALATVPLLLPPFLTVNSWLILLGNNGWWQEIPLVNLYSAGGTALVLSLMFWPIPFLA